MWEAATDERYLSVDAVDRGLTHPKRQCCAQDARLHLSDTPSADAVKAEGGASDVKKKRPPDSRDAQPASWHKAMAFVLTSAHEPCANPDFPLTETETDTDDTFDAM